MKIDNSLSRGNSVIHQWHPVLRVVWAVVWSVLVAVINSWLSLGVLLIGVFGLTLLSGIGGKVLLKRLAVMMGFIILIWLSLPFTFEGVVWWKWRWVVIYQPGVQLAARISLKMIIFWLIFSTLIATQPMAVLGQALKKMKVPDKLVLLLLLTYRYLFVITEEYTRLRSAMRIRGFQPGLNLHALRSYGYLMGMLFVRASVRAERVNQAMRLRGFKGVFYSLDDFSSYKAGRGLSIWMLMIVGLILMTESGWI